MFNNFSTAQNLGRGAIALLPLSAVTPLDDMVTIDNRRNSTAPFIK